MVDSFASLLCLNGCHCSQLLQMSTYKALQNLIPANVSGSFFSLALSISLTRPFSMSQIFSSFSQLCALVDAFLFASSLEEGRRMQLSCLCSCIFPFVAFSQTLLHLCFSSTCYGYSNTAFIILP